MANISREEAAARKAAAEKQKQDEGGGVDLRVSENPRDPVPNVAPDSPKPITPASGTLPFDVAGAQQVDVAQEAVDRAEAHGRVEMRKVVILRGYQPVGGGAFLKEGAEVEMRIEDARFLEESGIAQSADTYKKPAK